ncbi:hypothetical protein OUZ56_015258 [Daphnia magna]|uniref:BTB domain-containing protein n=1 Tax=Daphnia magna TaxID=35525 RepID=A0ABR0AM96_9CRUS|nr:hypothetical protein OUZ56_015258 [Daphnia magna]
MTSDSNRSFKFGSGLTSSTTPVKNVIRQVEIRIDQVQPSLFCVYCEWNVPKYQATPLEKPLTNDAIFGDKNANLKNPSQLGNNDGNSGTIKATLSNQTITSSGFGTSSFVKPQQQQPQPLSVFGTPSLSMNVDTMTAGLAQTIKSSLSSGMPIQTPTSTPAVINFGASECKLPQQQQTAHLDEKPQTKSFGTTFASATSEPSNIRGFQIPVPQLNTSLASSNNISDKPDAKETEYVADFTINQQAYTLKASFAKSTRITTGSIELKQVKMKSRLATEFDVGSDGKSIPGNRILEKGSVQLPSAVWVHLNRSKKKHHNLRFSNSDRRWVSEDFIGIFEGFRSSESGIGLWKSLACSIYVQFEIINAGETKALKQFTNLYVEQIYCDVQFSLRGEQKIGGHRSMLAARSPVFAAMFRNGMKEETTGQVKIEDCEPDVFKQLLHYIYSGKTSTPLTDTMVQSLFVVADKYDIQDLKEKCVTFLLTCLTMDNVVSLLVWSHLHLVERLKKVALTYMARNGKRICLLKDWEELAKNYPDLCVLAFRCMMRCTVHRVQESV